VGEEGARTDTAKCADKLSHRGCERSQSTLPLQRQRRLCVRGPPACETSHTLRMSLCLTERAVCTQCASHREGLSKYQHSSLYNTIRHICNENT
jgi:hypothetical protein